MRSAARATPAPSPVREVAARYVQTRLWRPRGVLAQSEWAELGRLPTAEARRDYLAAHELARLMLAKWTGVEPPLLRFRPSPQGSPELIPVEPSAPPRFGLSYADGLAMCVVAPCQVGVFLGSFRQVLTDSQHTAWNAFTPREREELEKLPTHTRTEHLLVQWTRREAAKRAQGRGMSGHRPEVVSIRLTPEHVAAVALMGAPAATAPLSVEEMAAD
jgi:4'-phosphopantetheinyl transferase